MAAATPSNLIGFGCDPLCELIVDLPLHKHSRRRATLAQARAVDIPGSAESFRYYAGWCTKIYGETNPSDPTMFNYTLREPVGVCTRSRARSRRARYG